MRLWADVPPEERMTEVLLRCWQARMQPHGGGGDAWFQNELQKWVNARCLAAVRWYDEIDGKWYWRQCQMSVKLGETRCWVHKEQP